MFGHVCSYFSVGFLVVTLIIVTLEDNGSIKSWFSVAMKIGASAKGLSWTVIPYASNWLVFTRVWYMVAPIYIALLRIRIVVSPVSGLFYAVDDWTMGTVFMVSYTSVYVTTSHYLPLKYMTMQLEPQTRLPAYESRYIVLRTTYPWTWDNTFLFPDWKPEILLLAF